MAKKRKPENKSRYCPYCDAKIDEAVLSVCKACEVEVFSCPKCHEAVPRDEKVCPNCGANIQEEIAKEK